MDDVVENKNTALVAEEAEDPRPPFEYDTCSVASLKHPDRNEDSFLVHAGNYEGRALIFDGVGGLEGGNIASKIACRAIDMEIFDLDSKDVEDIKSRLKAALIKAHQRVSEEAPGSETTATLAYYFIDKDESHFVIGSVGDTRAYILKDGELLRLTKDDSVIPEDASFDIDDASSEEDLSGEAKLLFKRRNIITQSLGGEVEPEPHLTSLKVAKGSKIVLTTDGVHDNLTQKEMEESVKEGASEAKALVRKAHLRSMQDHFRSKKDDMTAVVVKIN